MISSTQQWWLESFLSGYLGTGCFKSRAIAVILAPNRSANLKALKREDAVADDDDEEESDATEGTEETEASIRAVCNKVTEALEKKSLCVKEFRVAFSDESIYGKRKAYHDGLLVTCQATDNVFHDSKLWRRRFAQGVEMLARSPDTRYKYIQCPDPCRWEQTSRAATRHARWVPLGLLHANSSLRFNLGPLLP